MWDLVVGVAPQHIVSSHRVNQMTVSLSFTGIADAMFECCCPPIDVTADAMTTQAFSEIPITSTFTVGRWPDMWMSSPVGFI